MGIVSVLSAVFLFLSCYGRISTPLLAALSLSGGLLLLLAGRHHEHRHDSLTEIDQCAVSSGLYAVNPALKTIFFVLLLLLCVAADSVILEVFVFCSMTALTLGPGRTPVSVYLGLLPAPAAFILAGGLSLLLDYSPMPAGLLRLPFLGGWLVVTAGGQLAALLLLCRALAAVSCLYALSLSTPLYEIIGVLRAARVPPLMIELMFLIYRYIFILNQVLSDMTTAAAARFGFYSRAASMRTAGGIMANLLVLSFRRAGASYDAMESRCYDGRLEFFTTPKPPRPAQLLVAGGYLAGLSVLYLAERSFL